jgi:hypothetical protein
MHARPYVEGMLGISTFNMQLLALREINAMLETSMSSLLLGEEQSALAVTTAVEWLEAGTPYTARRTIHHHLVHPCSPRHPPHSIQVLAAQSTTPQPLTRCQKLDIRVC